MNPRLYKLFPRLATVKHDQTSPVDTTYDCVAWAAEKTDKWWWPDRRGYWPPGVTREETLEAFIAAFMSLGYAPCDNSFLEAETQKIAIYVNGDKPTHAARQLPDGTWTSKVGRLEDIRHESLEAIEGEFYGSVAQVMSRKMV